MVVKRDGDVGGVVVKAERAGGEYWQHQQQPQQHRAGRRDRHGTALDVVHHATREFRRGRAIGAAGGRRENHLRHRRRTRREYECRLVSLQNAESWEIRLQNAHPKLEKQ